MFKRLKCLFNGHRYTRVVTDPGVEYYKVGEFEVGDDSYIGEISLDVCVDCMKLKPIVKYECEYPIGHPKYDEYCEKYEW